MTISDIYNLVAERESKEWISEELIEKKSDFFDKCIKSIYKENQGKGFEMDVLYNEIISDYCKQGFIAGYKAAMSLLADATKVR